VLTVFHGKDSRALRVLWLLEELNLPFRLVNLPFPPRSRAPWFLERNPLGTLPLLLDGETRLTESVAILQYINGKYDDALGVPPSSNEYGQWLMWTVFGEATLNYTLSVCLRYGWIERPENRKTDVVEYYKARFLEKVGFLSDNIGENEYLVCSRFTIADISVAYNFVLAEYMGYMDDLPHNIKMYWSRLKERAAYQRCLQLERDTPRSFDRPDDL
jgi:glutathione S-transferase